VLVLVQVLGDSYWEAPGGGGGGKDGGGGGGQDDESSLSVQVHSILQGHLLASYLLELPLSPL
jgi:hypothetical protein